MLPFANLTLVTKVLAGLNDEILCAGINLSLITAGSLINILDGFRESKHKQFPYQLLMKDVLIKEDRILKAIRK